MKLLAKVCGLVQTEDAAFASASGADFLGFVSHPPSQRHCVDLTVALPFLDKAVLVKVADRAQEILEPALAIGFHFVQPYLPAKDREAGVRLLRHAGLFVILPWPDEAGQPEIPADLYLWESSPSATGLVGGSGQGHDLAFPPPGPFLLAGGLDATNLKTRMLALPKRLRVSFRGVDAASRLEASPGRKNLAKISDFIRTAHDLEFA
jgi:phosphoribosylanthranilate isomerase